VRIAATDQVSAGEKRTRLAVQDHAGTMPGRGAYLCRRSDVELPVADCLAEAMRRGGIPRALRSAVKLDPKLVESVSP
jgi:predicted RNA-binding protein YlxR (DUF448 family)